MYVENLDQQKLIHTKVKKNKIKHSHKTQKLDLIWPTPSSHPHTMPANIYNEGYGLQPLNQTSQTKLTSSLTNGNKTTHNKKSNKQTTPKQEFETIFNNGY